MLEVLSALPSGQVRTSQVGGTTDKLGQNLDKLGDGGLGQLSGSDSGVLGGVGRESLLPALGQSTLNSSLELRSLLGVLLLVLLEQVVPGGLLLGTLLGDLVVEVVGLLGDGEGLLRVEAPLRLELGDVVLLERCESARPESLLLLVTHGHRGHRVHPASGNRNQWWSSG